MQFINQYTKIDLTPIFITNLLGVVLMVILVLSKGWMIKRKRGEARVIMAMLATIIIGCVVEPITFAIDGIPGHHISFIAFFFNTVLYFLNVIIGPGYVYIIARHINGKLTKVEKYIIRILVLVEVLILCINAFFPAAFVINDKNIYERRGCFWIYVVIELFMMFFGLAIYLVAKAKGKMLRFFTAWEFFIPMFIGMGLQGAMYGVSVVWPCTGIAFCGIVLSLQNENIFLDKLTGVYNRYYLDEFKRSIRRKKKYVSGAMMLDMNGFKEINDKYSHEEGDIALKNVASILLEVVSDNGSVIRFAGDEFVIIVKTSKQEELDKYKYAILEKLRKYNETSGKPYKLSAAVGGGIFDFKDEEVSDFLNDIDALMYKDKALYYQQHDRRNR